ncbi:MAG: 30S ribosomal protein S15 [Candidatus Bathyarchaeota archaeon]|nr:MAG: 30S ribosomal protein S15 [Candidatus Bathyarchaeota archaeon]
MGKKEKGSSSSIRPVSKRPPGWCKYTPEEVEALVVKLGKEGHAPSAVGVILRDQHGIPLVKPIVGRTVTRILKDVSLAPSIPEDLDTLLKKAARLHAHMGKNKRDSHNKRALQIIEARIYKLARYYRREGLLPPDWKYKANIASPI